MPPPLYASLYVITLLEIFGAGKNDLPFQNMFIPPPLSTAVLFDIIFFKIFGEPPEEYTAPPLKYALLKEILFSEIVGEDSSQCIPPP